MGEGLQVVEFPQGLVEALDVSVPDGRAHKGRGERLPDRAGIVQRRPVRPVEVFLDEELAVLDDDDARDVFEILLGDLPVELPDLREIIAVA